MYIILFNNDNPNKIVVTKKNKSVKIGITKVQ